MADGCGRRATAPAARSMSACRSPARPRNPLQAAKERRQPDPEPLRDMREGRQRRRDPAGLHLPDVLLLEVDAPAAVGAELRHGEALLLTEHADALPHSLREERLAGNVGVDARRHQDALVPRATKST